MAEERSMSVKVYMDMGGGVQEVRRFGMPEAIATNFTCLKDKIRYVFALGNQDITVSWKGWDILGISVVWIKKSYIHLYCPC